MLLQIKFPEGNEFKHDIQQNEMHYYMVNNYDK